MVYVKKLRISFIITCGLIGKCGKVRVVRNKMFGIYYENSLCKYMS